MLIGLFIYFDFCLFLYNTISQYLDHKIENNWFPALYAIAHVGMLFSMLIYLKYWLSNDTFKDRNQLPRACLWIVITQFTTFIVVIVGVVPKKVEGSDVKKAWIEW